MLQLFFQALPWPFHSTPTTYFGFDASKVEVKVEVEVEVPKEEKEPEEPKEEVLFELPEEDKEFIYDNTHYTLRDIDNWHR